MNGPPRKTPFAATLDIRFVGAVPGRYLLPDSGSADVYSCRSVSLSPQSVVIAAAVVGEIGERIVLRFEQFNTLNAAVSQIVPGGFRADLVASDDERREMAAKINWLKRRSLKQVDNKREGQRVHPRDPRAYLYVDGTEHACFVIDVSTSGIAISAKLSPPVGTALAVGRVSGKVVRHMEGGIGIQFDELQPPETLFEAIAVRRPVAEGAQGG